MAKGKITEKAISSLQSEAKRTRSHAWLWDTELIGFGAKASPDGIQVSWVFQHWVGGKGGKAKRTVFGHLSNLDTEEARKRARKLRTDADDGIDILNRKQQRRHAQLERLKGAKLGETIERYLKLRYKPDPEKPRSYGMQVKGILESFAEKLGKDTLVAGVEKADIREILDAKQEAGQDDAARYFFAVVRPFFKWCVERDYLASSPLADISAPPPSKERERWFEDVAELKAFWRATERMARGEHTHLHKLSNPPNPIFGPFYQLLLLTAQRREEVAAIRWSEIDGEVWTIPGERTKNGEEHIVHLSPQAIAALKQVERQEGVDLLFTTTGDTPISGYSRAKARLDSLIELELDGKEVEPWVVHDLRRTAASCMEERLGIGPHVTDRILNHISGERKGLRRRYLRGKLLEERKRAIEAWGQYVDCLVSEKPIADNVIRLNA